jgi:hypothetical protein
VWATTIGDSAALDDALQDGLPIGAISELVGSECSGRSSIALSLLAGAAKIRRGFGLVFLAFLGGKYSSLPVFGFLGASSSLALCFMIGPDAAP